MGGRGSERGNATGGCGDGQQCRLRDGRQRGQPEWARARRWRAQQAASLTGDRASDAVDFSFDAKEPNISFLSNTITWEMASPEIGVAERSALACSRSKRGLG